MSIPRLIYFYQKHMPRHTAGYTKIQFEEIILQEMLTHHYFYGHGGYLSERTTLDGIFAHIKNIDKLYERYLNPPSVEFGKLAVDDETENAFKALQEADPKFIRWYEPEIT